MINWFVKDRKSFIELLAALDADFRENGSQWECQDLGTFLSQIAEYARNREAYLGQQGGNQVGSDWQFVADVFHAGRDYE